MNEKMNQLSRMDRLKNKIPNVDQIRITRQKIIITLLMILLLFIFLTTRGGSVNDDYDNTQEPPEYRDNPNVQEIPNAGGNYNLTNNYDNLPSANPPADWIGNIDFGGDIPTGGGGSGGSFPTISFPTGGDGFPGDGGGGADLPTINPPDGGNDRDRNLPTLDERRGPNDGGQGQANTDQGGGVKVPERPIKADNLLNISNYDFIPQIEIPSIGANFNNISFNLISGVFLAIFLSILYMDYYVIPRISEMLKPKEEDLDDSVFFKPIISEAEKRRQKERERALMSFSEHINMIIRASKNRLEYMLPEDIVIEGYHELDIAFSDFIKLRRSKNLTPLEHARMHFQTGELNQEALENIVDLFYRARFAKQKMKKEDVVQFNSYLYDLVVRDIEPGEDQ